MRPNTLELEEIAHLLSIDQKLKIDNQDRDKDDLELDFELDLEPDLDEIYRIKRSILGENI